MAKLIRHPSLVVAEKVLKAVNANGGIPAKLATRLTVGSYENGREQGLHIHGYVPVPVVESKDGWDFRNVSISFAENRNSDDIVVYLGQPGEVWDGSIPSTRAYEKALYFRPGKYGKAAEAIVKHLKSLKVNF